jgi:hypothetical protein
MNTCDKLGISSCGYLGDRLAIPDAPDVRCLRISTRTYFVLLMFSISCGHGT